MDLYNFFNSSAAYRVRIALALKGIEWNAVSVNLRGGAQHEAAYRSINPGALVPTLVDEGRTIGQSIAIFDYLDRTYPSPELIPRNDPERARVLEIAMTIACDIHPLNNLRVLKYLTERLHLMEEEKADWTTHWLETGFATIEALLPDSGNWCVGDSPTLADCCLVPQVANALRAKFNLDPFPLVRRIYDHCMQHAAFQAASPAMQPDYIAH